MRYDRISGINEGLPFAYRLESHVGNLKEVINKPLMLYKIVWASVAKKSFEKIITCLSLTGSQNEIEPFTLKSKWLPALVSIYPGGYPKGIPASIHVDYQNLIVYFSKYTTP